MKNWKKTILSKSSIMKEAIEVLETQQLRIVLVADKADKLLGVVTDGDIRRALVSGCSLESSLSDFMEKNPMTSKEGEDSNLLISRMNTEDISSVPILNLKNEIVGLETRQNILLKNKKENFVFLMAGGFGTRLRPLTNSIPKPLLKVGSKPLLENILTKFLESGFSNFFISTHFQAKKVQDYFEDGSKWGAKIQYVHEEEPLGTAGALGLLPKKQFKEPFLVMNADLLTKLNFSDLLNYHLNQDSFATVCLAEYDFKVPYGVVEIKNSYISAINEKPTKSYFINAGIYVLDPSALTSIKKGKYLDMPDLLKDKIAEGKQVSSFPLHEYWLDIGRLPDYQKANRDFEK